MCVENRRSRDCLLINCANLCPLTEERVHVADEEVDWYSTVLKEGFDVAVHRLLKGDRNVMLPESVKNKSLFGDAFNLVIVVGKFHPNFRHQSRRADENGTVI